VIVLDPTGRVDAVNVATPPLSMAVPNIVAPFLNVTVPVGTPPEEVTVAVKVMVCVTKAGFSDEVSAVVVAAFVTSCDTDPKLLPVKFASPPQAAVMECVPSVSVLTVIVAWLELTVAVPSVFPPSLNVTVPVALPPNCGVSEAVNVTAWL